MSDTATAADRQPTRLADLKPGKNDILVKTAHYGLQPMLMEKDVAVRSRDGTKLFVNVFRPLGRGRFPIVLSADLLDKDSSHMVWQENLPGGSPNTHGQYGASSFAALESPDPGFWVPNGYVVVKAGLRGSSGGKGLMSPLSQMEAEDYYDLIEWAGVQPWSNGKVGTNGVSYLAMTQWRVGQLNPPHLKAMIPWEGVSDAYREWSFHGGIPETGFCPFFDNMIKSLWPDSPSERLEEGRNQHPLFDDYWKGRHGSLAKIKVPLFICASWSTQGLHCRGTIEGFKQARSRQKWLEIHGRKEWETYYSREALEKQKRFFDYFLKGAKNGWEKTPKVRYEVRERFYDGTFKTASSWPLPGTRPTKLHLGPRGHLYRVRPKTAGTISYQSTAPNTDRGRAVFRFKFDRDTELTGPMKLKLWVSTDAGDDLDLFIGIKKFDRYGSEVLMADFNHKENGRVAKGWLRVSHRELDQRRSTPLQPWLRHRRELKVAPGEIVPVEIEILPSSTMFRKGESLELTVQGGDLDYQATVQLPAHHGRIVNRHDVTANRGRHSIHAGGKFDSHLLVPVIP